MSCQLDVPQFASNRHFGIMSVHISKAMNVKTTLLLWQQTHTYCGSVSHSSTRTVLTPQLQVVTFFRDHLTTINYSLHSLLTYTKNAFNNKNSKMKRDVDDPGAAASALSHFREQAADRKSSVLSCRAQGWYMGIRYNDEDTQGNRKTHLLRFWTITVGKYKHTFSWEDNISIS